MARRTCNRRAQSVSDYSPDLREQLGLQTTSRRNTLPTDGRSEEVDVTEPIRLELERRPTYEDCLVLLPERGQFHEPAAR